MQKILYSNVGNSTVTTDATTTIEVNERCPNSKPLEVTAL